MTGTLDEQLGFVATGTALCARVVEALEPAELAAPSLLPRWSRAHVVAHLAANAEALGRLLHWARTGERTPMYASPERRAADIEAGAALPASELTAWFRRSADLLSADFAGMPPSAWAAEVVTAQGRTVPASQTPWMRSREVMVHAVDLATGLSFADLPPAFLTALRDEILAKRAAERLPELHGALADVTAYLAGRPHGPVTADAGAPPPDLSPWL